MHHLMVSCFSLDDVGAFLRVAAEPQERVSVTLGRHTNDLITLVLRQYAVVIQWSECGWGGREIDQCDNGIPF